MTQLTFDFPPPVVSARSRKRDPDGSRVAAQRYERTGAGASDRVRVLEALRRFGPCTSKQLALWSGLDRHLCGKRLPDLLRLRLAEKCGKRSDSREDVWRVTH